MPSAAVHVCPICASVSPPRAANPAFPFCSPTCKLVDLGKWLDGVYRVEGSAVETDESDDVTTPETE